MERTIAEIEGQTGLRFEKIAPMAGGEQEGALLVSLEDHQQAVLKLQPDRAKAKRLIRAAPVVVDAVQRGWPAAAWTHWGQLADGSAYLLQQYLAGPAVEIIDRAFVDAVLRANARQGGLADPRAVDDSSQLADVTRGNHPWRDDVGRHSPAGAALVEQGTAVISALGPTPLPGVDLVHGDYSSANMIMDATGDLRFIDCETVGRGTRVRDLADLYRQCVVYPGTSPAVMDRLLEQAIAVAGPAVFLTCLVAVSYNNLAWWVEHQPLGAFDVACDRLRVCFDQLAAVLD